MLATSSAFGIGTKFLVDVIAEKINNSIFPIIGFAETGIYFLASTVPIVRYSREGCIGNGESLGNEESCLEMSKKCCKLTALVFPGIGIAALGALIRLNNGGMLVFPIVSTANLLANGLSNADIIAWIGGIEGISALFGAFIGRAIEWNLLIESAACITPLAITVVGWGLERKKITSFDEEIVEKKFLAKTTVVSTLVITVIGAAAGVLINGDTYGAAALASSMASVTATSLVAGGAFIGYNCHKIADKFSDYVSSLNCCGAIANCSKWVWNKICCKQ